MGSVFARPPARARLEDLGGSLIGLEAGAGPLAEVEAVAPVVLCVGGERGGLPRLDVTASIPMRAGGPESLNAAMAATVGLYELGNRIARNA